MPFSKLKNRNLMLLDVIYQQPSKLSNWKDYITIVYRDVVTDKKETLTIEEPTIDLYTVKPEYRTFKKPRHFLPIQYLDKKTVKYKNVKKKNYLSLKKLKIDCYKNF